MKELLSWAVVIIALIFIATVASIIIFITSLVGDSNKNLETFIDSRGISWVVLTVDENGNKLVITEHVHGMTKYNTENIYTFLGDSDDLRLALNEWFVNQLAPELEAVALPVENVNNDVRRSPRGGDINHPQISLDIHNAFVRDSTENTSDGLSMAGSGIATADNAIFILSISEVNKYRRTLNVTANAFNRENDFSVSWWLRSPGMHTNSPVAIMNYRDSDNDSIISSVPADETYGFRPALWISSIPE